MTIQRNNIEEVVSSFLQERDAYGRYASFDYCYNYFNPNQPNHFSNNIEVSCYYLGFYLASWGMFRGSSFLLNKSVKALEKVILYIAKLDREAWAYDAGTLSENSDHIIEIYENIKENLVPAKSTHRTLVTKVMLGVFGSVPAYDRFFVNTFKGIFSDRCAFSTFSNKSLKCIDDFYTSNESCIDKLFQKTTTLSFNGTNESYNYKRSKIIDMYGFTTSKN